jgi:N,N'-diacetylchitobiose phosphorylase
VRYGYFDDTQREYIITRPDTPRSWINYLGSRLFGGIITQNAGGYSFYLSGGYGRLSRLRFNGIPVDAPGRYIYLRDDNSGDYWSASWQPVAKPLDTYKHTVRHGLGYTAFETEYSDIRSTFLCFIPEGRAFEYWSLEVSNPGPVSRTLSIFSYAELTNDWNFRQDLENLQYSQYIVQTTFEGMIHRRNNNPPDYNDMYFALAGADIVSFDTDRDAFLGPYRTPANPLMVERGRCSDSLTIGDNACCSLHTKIELAPGERRTLIFILGVGKPDGEWNGLPSGQKIVAEFGTPERVAHELETIRNTWASRLDTFQVTTPDPDLNSMLNVWHAYQTHMTFNWSRGVSLIEAGGRDGLGYRDTVQDMLAVTHSIPNAVEERLDLILTGQVANGGAMPLVMPLTHTPGKETAPTENEYRSDDALWLPLTVTNFIYETGNTGYLDKVLPYADYGSATVYEHLMQALQFSLDRRGTHGLLLGLHADWNDCIHGGMTGQSLFSTFLFYHACRLVEELATLTSRTADAEWCQTQRRMIKEQIDRNAWDGSWFIRALATNGGKLGSQFNPEGQIYLESNVWAVISGAADSNQAYQAMDAVHDRLSTEYGVMLCNPPHTIPNPDIELSLLVFPPGHKENGGIFCHSNSWAIVAECVLKHGDRAYEYYRSYLPAAYNELAEIRQVEPYVYSQFTHGKSSPRFGQSRNPWLTGTASWTYIAVTHYILGLRPAANGLRIDPCIPSRWNGFTVRRRYRNCWIDIKVENHSHVTSGVRSLTLNGMSLPDNIIPPEQLRAENSVNVILG